MRQCGFHIWVTIGFIILIVPTIFTWGIAGLLYIPLILANLIVPIVGAVKASGGYVYEPPISGPISKRWFNI